MKIHYSIEMSPEDIKELGQAIATTIAIIIKEIEKERN